MTFKQKKPFLFVLFNIQHPEFDNQFLLNDVAILKLEELLKPSTTIQFACLARDTVFYNMTGTVVGFGDTKPGANRGETFQFLFLRLSH